MEPPTAPMGDITRADGLDPHIVYALRVNGQPREVSSPQRVVSVPLFDCFRLVRLGEHPTPQPYQARTVRYG
ncbi:hypothetical protein P354_09465 [Streptomyces noursei PD-1]|uniref:Uncharacterized protein n=1 Tax=Streptomyces noursei TaxID=1971 RepID=A0A401QYT1_STRNR|nr:hypothetical protein K530_19935 [Streptomyces noursei CCRC 11814]EXU85516.1 hypothetical protein P354_09465 [Streptomyces noursei PD-1]GCB90512.1 hypothetical protein SALB_03219 [Streptomyces noursei]